MTKNSQVILSLLAIVLLGSANTLTPKQKECYKSIGEEQKLYTSTAEGKEYLVAFKHFSTLLDEHEKKKTSGELPKEIKEAEHKSSEAWKEFLVKHGDEYKEINKKNLQECKGISQKTIKEMTKQIEQGRTEF